MRIQETIEVKQNLVINARERGKLVATREGHNIWLDLGREYLAQLIAYQSYGPDVPFRDDRVRYMGVGIGGTAQTTNPLLLNDPVGPLAPYPGLNTQTDDDPTVASLERPVRVSGSATVTPGIAGDIWLGQVGSADPFTIPTECTFRRAFTELEVSYGQFIAVPLSEIGLFTSAADPGTSFNNPVAYDTFDPLNKTAAFTLEVIWTIRF